MTINGTIQVGPMEIPNGMIQAGGMIRLGTIQVGVIPAGPIPHGRINHGKVREQTFEAYSEIQQQSRLQGSISKRPFNKPLLKWLRARFNRQLQPQLLRMLLGLKTLRVRIEHLL